MDTYNKVVGIVGAGPVGLTLANRLSSFGIKSIVLEKSPHLLKKGSKACLIQGDALEVLDKINCAETIAEEGIVWHTAHTYIRNKECITQVYPVRTGFSEFTNISQYRIERLLCKQIKQSIYSEILWSHEVVEITQNHKEVTVRSKTPDGDKVLHFDYLVACDGVRSIVRKLMGIAYEGYTLKNKFLITDIKVNLSKTKARHFYFDPDFNPGRQVVMHPQPDNIWRIDWQLSPNDDIKLEKTNGQLDKRIQKVIGNINYKIEWISTYCFNQRIAEYFKVERIFFAGDAAHTFPPYGSRGMNSGIQDADNLAWKLAYVLKGVSDKALLDTYHIERKAAAEENFKITEDTIKFMVPPSLIRKIVRNFVLIVSSVFKNVRKKVNHGKMFTPFKYKESNIVSKDNNLFVGTLISDTPIYIGNKKTRFRKLFNDRFSILFIVADKKNLEPFIGRKDHAIPTNYLAAFPKGTEPTALENINIIYYDDVLFFKQLCSGVDSVIIIRPDGYIAARYSLGSFDSLDSVLKRHAMAIKRNNSISIMESTL